MQNLTPEIWQALGIGAAIGFIVGYLLLRMTKGSVKKQLKTEAELQQVKTQLENQKQQLEKHFTESADLLKNLAQDYQKFYHHLAQASTNLLPEQAEKPTFVAPLLTDESTHTAEKTDTLSVTTSSDEQPRDYSGGSSGILKAER